MGAFNNTDIRFNIGGCQFHAVNITSTVILNDFPLHSHGIGCYEIHYISEGCGTLIADGKKYEIVPNTLYITGPLVSHAQITDKVSPMHEWGIYLKTDDNEHGNYDSLIKQFLSRKFWIGQDTQGLLPLFRRLFSELEDRPAGYSDMAKLLISEAVIGITRNYISSSSESSIAMYNSFERSSLTIEEYFLYEYRTACLEELAKRLTISPRQTQRLIKKLYGSSFSEKKTQARMSAAQLLLSDGSLSLTDISEKLGYSSQEYFTAAFKKYYGISPGRFKKSQNYENATFSAT